MIMIIMLLLNIKEKYNNNNGIVTNICLSNLNNNDCVIIYNIIVGNINIKKIKYIYV
jgi:hypothetical protein